MMLGRFKMMACGMFYGAGLLACGALHPRV
jgi:hypothetical protein